MAQLQQTRQRLQVLWEELCLIVALTKLGLLLDSRLHCVLYYLQAALSSQFALAFVTSFYALHEAHPWHWIFIICATVSYRHSNAALISGNDEKNFQVRSISPCSISCSPCKKTILWCCNLSESPSLPIALQTRHIGDRLCQNSPPATKNPCAWAWDILGLDGAYIVCFAASFMRGALIRKACRINCPGSKHKIG